MTPFARVAVPDLLVSAMRVNRENHRIIAGNIANVDTPHYNPKNLDFQATLRAAVEGRGRVALRTTQLQHLGKHVDRFAFGRVASMAKNDYNKVDIEDQTSKLSENTNQYVVYGSLLTKHFEQVKDMLTALR